VPKGVRPYTQTVSVVNRGYGSPELEFSSIGVTGAPEFSIESVTVNDEYVTTPAFATALAGDSAERMEITVSFASGTGGTFTGNLVLKSNDPTAPTKTIPLQALVPDVWFDMTGAGAIRTSAMWARLVPRRFRPITTTPPISRSVGRVRTSG
jgi:hypothetical protein